MTMEVFHIIKGHTKEVVHAIRQETETHVQSFCGNVVPLTRCIITNQPSETVGCKRCTAEIEKEM